MISPHESALKWVLSIQDIPHYVNMEVYVIEDNPQEFLHCKKREDQDTREINQAWAFCQDNSVVQAFGSIQPQPSRFGPDEISAAATRFTCQYGSRNGSRPLTHCLSCSRLTLERVYLQPRSWLERRKRRTLRLLGCNPLRLLLRVLPTLEKVHSDMELDAGMHKMARTARAKIGNLSDFTHHHGNRPTSCLTSPSSRALFRVSGWSRTSLSFLEALNRRYSANS